MAKKEKENTKCVQVPSSSTPPPSTTWGYVKIKEDLGHQPLIYVNCPKKGATLNHYTWWPGEDLKGEVVDGSVVILRCETTHDGERHFSPIGTGKRSHDPFSPFYAFAFSCGLAIRIKSNKMTGQQRYSYRAMFFLFQRAQKMREHIKRVFIRRKDLIVAKSGWRGKGRNEQHILPWQFNSMTQEAGYPQSVDALMELGAESRTGQEYPTRRGPENPLWFGQGGAIGSAATEA